MAYQQNQQKPKTCINKDANGRECGVLITWVPNPNKPGFNPKTNKPWAIPWEINTNQQHRCPNFNQQTNQMVDRAIATGTSLTSTKPAFTPNNQSVENIETHLARLVTLTEEMRDFMEIMVRDTKVKPASDHNIPEEHKEYQNNTAYTEDNTEVSSERYAGEHDKW